MRAQADSSILTRISEISKSVDAAHAELMTGHANAGESLLEDPINDLQGKVFRAVDVLQKGLLERETEVRDRRRLRCGCFQVPRALYHHGGRVGSSAPKRGYCGGVATSRLRCLMIGDCHSAGTADAAGGAVRRAPAAAGAAGHRKIGAVAAAGWHHPRPLL